MNRLNLKDNILARICSCCSICRQALDIPFVGVRAQPGVIRDYREQNSEDNIDQSVLCGAGLPANLDAWDLVEHPIVSVDGKLLGIFFAPSNAATASTNALRPFVAKIEEQMRKLDQGIGTSTFSPQNTDEIPPIAMQIFDLSVEPFCIASADGFFKRANTSFLNAFGLSEDDLKKTPFLALVHPADRMASVDALDDLLENGSISGFRNRYISRNNQYRWFEWNAAWIDGEELFFASARDVTDNVHAEERARETNAVLQTVNNALTDYISQQSSTPAFDGMLSDLLRISRSEYGFICELMRDPDGTPYLKSHALSNITWDEASRRLYERHAADGMEFRNLDTFFGKVITTGKPVFANPRTNASRPAKLPPGHPPLDAFLGIPIYSGETLIGVIGIANNPEGYTQDSLSNLTFFLSACSTLILAMRTERARSSIELLLNKAEKRHRAIFDSTMDSIVVFDASGLIESANPASSEMFGLPMEELQGTAFWRLLSIDARETLQAFLDKARVDPDARIRREFDASPHDGRELTLDVSLSATRVGAEVLIVSVLRDITNIKQAERELLASRAAAENANQAKSDFLAHISHELRTPITGVIGMLELAMLPSTSEEKYQYLITASNCADSVLYVVNDLLDFAKVEANQLILDESVFNLRNIIRELAIEPLHRAITKGLTLTIVVDDSLPEHITGDFMRLRQVLLNLLSNAIKFTEHGSIKLTASAVSSSTGSTKVRFEVSDTGIGISNSQRQKIFRAFTQADSSITRRFGGTGLGLSISSRLVELMGGRLSVDSTLGEGSCFYFEIELRHAAEHVGMSATTEDSAPENTVNLLTMKTLAPRKLLIAEDNPVNQMLISNILIRRGHSVELAKDGEQAVALASENDFDVILMDLQMPKLDGIEATRMIRSNEGNGRSRTKIIALTAHALKSDAERCRAVGMDGFLSKPIQARDLMSAVEDTGI